MKSDDCPSIKLIVDKPNKKKTDALYIKNSFCGNIIGKLGVIKVCCSTTGEYFQNLKAFCGVFLYIDRRTIWISEAILGCGLPKPPENGKYTVLGNVTKINNRLPIETLIRYECESFDEKPDIYRISHCQNDGEWSYVEPCLVGNYL